VVETMKRMAAVVDRQRSPARGRSSPADANSPEGYLRDSLFVDVECSLAWISRYRGLNTIFERTEGHLVVFIKIAFISILSRRIKRLATQEIST